MLLNWTRQDGIGLVTGDGVRWGKAVPGMGQDEVIKAGIGDGAKYGQRCHRASMRLG